jgi:hypothetical protein
MPDALSEHQVCGLSVIRPTTSVSTFDPGRQVGIVGVFDGRIPTE